MRNKKGLLGLVLILLALVVVGFFYFRNSMTGNMISEKKDIYEQYCEDQGFEVGTSFYDNGVSYGVCVNDVFEKCDIEKFYTGDCNFTE